MQALIDFRGGSQVDEWIAQQAGVKSVGDVKRSDYRELIQNVPLDVRTTAFDEMCDVLRGIDPKDLPDQNIQFYYILQIISQHLVGPVEASDNLEFFTRWFLQFTDAAACRLEKGYRDRAKPYSQITTHIIQKLVDSVGISYVINHFNRIEPSETMQSLFYPCIISMLKLPEAS